MKKIIILLIILIVLSFSAQAKLVNKDLNITIPNCYSVNISAELQEGTSSAVEFVGCKKITSNEFFCDCLNADNKNFSVIMRTDNTLIRNIRQYEVYITAIYFDIYKKTLSINVEDGGDYYERSDNDWKERDNRVKYVKDIEYIDRERIVYKDKIVEVPKEIIVYQDKIINNTIYINKTEYIENTTKIKNLQEKMKNQNKIIYLVLGFGFFGILAIILIYYFNKN